MRKSLLFVLVLVWAITAILCTPASAQTKPTFFANVDQCQAALMSGVYTPYTTRGKWHGKKVSKKDTTVTPVEASACVHGITTAGWQWVVAPAGFKLRWSKTTGQPVAMESCGGNPVDAIVFAPTPTTPAPTPTQTTSVLQGIPTPPSNSFNTTIIDSFNTKTTMVTLKEVSTEHQWFCARHPVGCTVGGFLGAGTLYAIFNRGGDHHHEQVVTKPPCTHLPCS